MANQEHLNILMQGVEVWNQWNSVNSNIVPDLSGADLSEMDLLYARFDEGNLSQTNLSGARLGGASFISANLTGANFSKAALDGTNFLNADLTEVNLKEADLTATIFSGTNLQGADFSYSYISATIFAGVDLSKVKGLESRPGPGTTTIDGHWPTFISIDTIYLSKGNIPKTFLCGAAIPNSFIDYMHSLVGKPIDFYSCFISYSSKNEDFARRLHADLQDNGVRCWFAPEDLKIGDKFRHRIDESIRMYDKLLLVLSEDSLASTWVSYEVEKALNKEPEGIPNVLFPIRLDKSILTCEAGWAEDIRKSRHIGDFEHWKDHDAYQLAFQRLLRDLKTQS